MAVALKQTADPHTLLTAWSGQGWRVYRQAVLKPVPAGPGGAPVIPLQLDAFEWVDITFFGVGNVDDAIAKLGDYIRAGGSDLYAYCLFKRTDFDNFGVKVIRYRLLLLHSIVQLIGAAILILAIAFAAIIFIQYVTTGRSAAVEDLKGLWGSGVTSVGQAVGQAGSAVVSTYVWATLAAGGGLLLLGVLSKDFGVKTPSVKGPRGSVGVNTGPVRASLSS